MARGDASSDSRSNARRTPRSVATNASGSRSARIRTYSAVHGPIPSTRKSVDVASSGSPSPLRSRSPLATSSATRRIAPARREVIPSCSSGASISRSASGKSIATTPSGRDNGSPKRDAMRQSIVRAPGTETCCPVIARTASSKPSAAPGTRTPRLLRMSGRRVGSPASVPTMGSGSASRSRSRREIAIADERARSVAPLISSRT